MGRGGGRWCGDDATPATRAAQVRGRGGETGGEACGRLGVAGLVEGDCVLVLAVLVVEVRIAVVGASSARLEGGEVAATAATEVVEATEDVDADGCGGS